MALIHLFPEADEKFREFGQTSYPFASLIVLISYTFILVIEKVAFNAHDLLELHHHEHNHHNGQHDPCHGEHDPCH